MLQAADGANLKAKAISIHTPTVQVSGNITAFMIMLSSNRHPFTSSELSAADCSHKEGHWVTTSSCMYVGQVYKGTQLADSSILQC